MVVNKLCRKDFNEAKSTNSTMSWQNYKVVLSTYKKTIRKAKRVKLALFCSEMESTREASRLRKILAKTDNHIGYIQKPLGNWTISCEETLCLLFDVHFPCCSGTAPSDDQCTAIDDAIIEKSLITILNELYLALNHSNLRDQTK